MLHMMLHSKLLQVLWSGLLRDTLRLTLRQLLEDIHSPSRLPVESLVTLQPVELRKRVLGDLLDMAAVGAGKGGLPRGEDELVAASLAREAMVGQAVALPGGSPALWASAGEGATGGAAGAASPPGPSARCGGRGRGHLGEDVGERGQLGRAEPAVLPWCGLAVFAALCMVLKTDLPWLVTFPKQWTLPLAAYLNMVSDA